MGPVRTAAPPVVAASSRTRDTMQVGPLAQGYVLVVLVALPLLTTGEEKLEEAFSEVDDRRPLYLSAVFSLLLAAGVTWAVASWAGLPGRSLGWILTDPEAGAAWAAAVAAGGLGAVAVVTPLARRLGWEESRAVFFLLPRDRREKTVFVVLALAAGICEEYVYRGFAFHVLEAWTGSAWLAVGATALSFGLAHGYQRAAGVLRATLLGILLALPVARTGSLFPAVVAHAGINVLVGLGGWRWLAPGIRRGATSVEHQVRRREADDAGTEREPEDPRGDR